MSSAFELTVNVNSSGRFSRAFGLSVRGVVVGVADEVQVFSPSKPEMPPAALIVAQLVASSLSEPAIMYGPEEMT